RANLTGIDLSEAYVRHARAELGASASVDVGNAEALPYADESFDAVVSAFMFHELPARARRRVFSEMVRVLKPAGGWVLEDAARLAESRDLAAVTAAFSRDLPEPFFAQYLRVPLEDLVDAALERPRSRPPFVAKLVSARKRPA